MLLIIGTEPQLRWRTYCAELTEVAQLHGARLCLTLGALLAEVPHTRPTPIVGTAYEPEVVAGLELQPSRYEGPTGIVGVLHDAWRRAGLRSASLWATVPAYVPGAPSPKAALALVERAAAMLQTWIPTTDLEIAAASVRAPGERARRRGRGDGDLRGLPRGAPRRGARRPAQRRVHRRRGRALPARPVVLVLGAVPGLGARRVEQHGHRFAADRREGVGAPLRETDGHGGQAVLGEPADVARLQRVGRQLAAGRARQRNTVE